MEINLKVISSINSAADAALINIKGLSISGVVNKQGVGLPCNIRLYEKLTGRLLQQRKTDPIGQYSFDHLTAIKYFIVAHDPSSQYNAVIQDNVVPK